MWCAYEKFCRTKIRKCISIKQKTIMNVIELKALINVIDDELKF